MEFVLIKTLLITGNVVKSFKESAITSYFFGQSGKERKLTVEEFIKFQQKLQVLSN